MKSFEYLEHTADAKFRAYGKTLEEAFANAALAMFNLVVDTQTVKPVLTKKVEVKAKKKESLLFDFMDELIYLLSEGFLLHEVKQIKIIKGDVFELTATVVGDEHKNYVTHGDVKAATYHDMLIEEKPNAVMVQVVVDV